ncbi:probable serine/threonine-protein kinase At1g54610 isoform X1 [Aegilops tauschii subsp. strangulata]|uniref:probable serine/threonine-protein kinase At1g54610 isoform X1 n=1 Tax=Aegilops tauschii subsp. strangulata TaxID=200361 RepID=UPI001ABCE523|nr:probable serine/threonine-protein kinase At1g54610 isoform X1 [Aegilops tauschii subsp. strangulata]
MVISCQAQILARKTAKIGLDLIHLFKKASHVLMGCLCSKGTKDHADATSENREPSSKDDPKTASGTNDGSKVMPYAGEKVVVAFDARFSSCNNAELKGLSGEHVVSGWPTWLAYVAPKAVDGWLPRRADSFEKLDKIGQGTYSIVYKARDLETGKIVALKKVRFVNMDPESVRFMAREIHILRRLDHPNIIKLEGIVTSRVSQSLYLVFEYMEHDLSGLIASPGLKLTESQIKCFVQQLLHGLDHCHKNGVLHRDIKGSNLLIDSNGVLKIADFGLATSFDPDNPKPLTSRVVTLWYRPPELLLGSTEYSVAVDMWSTGCIVAELFAGKPIMPGRTEVEQIHKIFKLCGSPMDDYCKKSKVPETAMFKPQQQYRRCVAETFKDFPPSTVVLIDSLLSLEPEVRGTASSALQSDFFKTEPLACDPSSLPKFPASKEYDVRLRQEEERRQRKAALGGRGAECSNPGNENHVTSRAVNGAAESKEHAHASSKSSSVKFYPEDSVPGFRVEPRPSPTTVQVPGFGSTWNMGGYTDHPTTPGCACSSVHVANSSASRTKASSHSHIPQFCTTDLRNAVEVTYQNQPPDRPASSHNKNPLEVQDAMISVLLLREVLRIYILSSHMARTIAFLWSEPWKEAQEDPPLGAIGAAGREYRGHAQGAREAHPRGGAQGTARQDEQVASS